ncbi:nucleotide-binding domain containing protein [Saccharopolyspora sp. 5N708]|uniref:nucleotide-binding domain containing protein n=1 Tax=Saccharopolyspora sp. 5N708 TaxID=3457424 RepID=UPI003FD2E897
MDLSFAGYLGALALDHFRAVVATGGDTAMAIARALDATALQPLGRYGVGIVETRVVGGPFDGLTLVMKPGAYGPEDAVVNSVRRARATASTTTHA